MFCTDELLEGVSKAKCPQGILRGFTGKITLKDWRGYNSLNPNISHRDSVIIDEANRYSIMPTSTPEVRDDNLTVYMHGLSFSVKSITEDTLLALVTLSNIPVIVEIEMEDGNVMALFSESGAKLLTSNNLYGKDGELSMINCVNYHREARESRPPITFIPEVILDFQTNNVSPSTFMLDFNFNGAGDVKIQIEDEDLVVGEAVSRDFVDQKIRNVKVTEGSFKSSDVVELTVQGAHGQLSLDNLDNLTELTIRDSNLDAGRSVLTGFSLSPLHQITTFALVYTDFSGEVDLSDLIHLDDYINISFNRYLTSIILPDLATNSIRNIAVRNNDLYSLDLSPLHNLWNTIYAQNNPNLSNIILPSNNNSFAVFNVSSCNLGNIDFSVLPNLTAGSSSLFSLEDNNMLESEVDYNLDQLDQVSVGGYIDRFINISGNNSAPSVLGLASKASLEAKGFTVIVTVPI